MELPTSFKNDYVAKTITEEDLARNNIYIVREDRKPIDKEDIDNTYDFRIYQNGKELTPYVKLGQDYCKVCVRPVIDGKYHQLMFTRLVNTLLGYKA